MAAQGNNKIGTAVPQGLRARISILVQLANVDDEFHPRELSFIYGVGLRNNLDLDTIGDIIASPEPVIGVKDLTPEEKISLLSDSIQLIQLDGKVLPREVAFCLDMASRLGLGNPDVRLFIKEAGRVRVGSGNEIKATLTRLIGSVDQDKSTTP